MRVFSAADVQKHVPMSSAMEALRHVFLGYANGDFVMPGRTSLASGQVLVMPVLHTPTGSAAINPLNIQLDRNARRLIGGGKRPCTSARGSVNCDGPCLRAPIRIDAPDRQGEVSGLAASVLSKPDRRTGMTDENTNPDAEEPMKPWDPETDLDGYSRDDISSKDWYLDTVLNFVHAFNDEHPDGGVGPAVTRI